jgi:hypothetical protein
VFWKQGGWECDADGKEHKCMQTYCGKSESRKAENYLEDICVDDRILWRVTLNTERESLEWIGLALEKDKWFAVVKMVLNYWFQ